MSAVRLLPMVVRSSVKRSKEGTPAGGFSPSSPSRTSRAHWCVTADMNCFVVCCCFFIFVEVGRAGGGHKKDIWKYDQTLCFEFD